jgi:hypothetical protein
MIMILRNTGTGITEGLKNEKLGIDFRLVEWRQYTGNSGLFGMVGIF